MTTEQTKEDAARPSGNSTSPTIEKRSPMASTSTSPSEPKSSPFNKKSKSPSRKKKATTSSKPKSASTASTTATTKPILPIQLAPTHTLILDNGGDTIKYGWITDTSPKQIPNITARLIHQFTTLVGDELFTISNPNSLTAHTRSIERNLIVNFETQTRVWKRILDLLNVMIPLQTETAKCFGWNITTGRNKSAKKQSLTSITTTSNAIPSQSIAVILLLPPYMPRAILDQIFHIWIEDFAVAYLGLGISSVCASYNEQTSSSPYKTSCIVDLGWSSTLIVPSFKGKVINNTKNKSKDKTTCIRRIPIGGRHFINILKYYMSYRQYNLMDQTHIMKDVFERLAFISLNIGDDLQSARNKSAGKRIYDREYILPDYQKTYQGVTRIPALLEREIEKEEQKKKKTDEQGKKEDEDEEDDEDFVDEDAMDEESDEDGDGENYEIEDDAEDASKKGKRSSKSSKKTAASRKKKRKRNDQKIKNSNTSTDSDNDDDDVEDEEESWEEKRKRLLQQRAEEQHRRRKQEQEEQVLLVSVERFTVPEILFRPLDAGLQSDLIGLAEAIVQSIEACPMPYPPALYQSVYLVGGVALLPNLKERLERELRSLVPSEYKLKIAIAESPIDQAWMGAKTYFQQEPYTKWSVSRQEWEDASKRKAYTKLLMNNGGCYI